MEHEHRTVTKSDIISWISEDREYNNSFVTDVIDGFVGMVSQYLSQGCKVRIDGFGTFEPKKRAARTGRNPHTGEMVPIPRRTTPNFKAHKYLKELVQREGKW